NADIDGNVTVDGWSDLDSLHVAENADFDADVNIDGNSQTDGNADIDGNVTVDGWSDLDSLHVAENADFDADVNIDGNSQTDGNADIDGNLDVDGNTSLDTTYITDGFQFDGYDYEADSMSGDFIVGAQQFGAIVEEYTTIASGNATILASGDEGGSSDDGSNGNITLGAATAIYLDASGDGADASLTLDSLGVDLDSWVTMISDSLHVGGNVDFDASLNVDGNFQTDGNADIDGNLDVDGVSNLDTTDIDGSLNVQDMATFQANVQVNDSLNVTNDAHIGGNFQVDLNSDLDGTLDVDGDTELDTTNIDGSLTVRDFADLNDSLDVAKSVNIQDNLDVNDSLTLNSAANEGRILTVYDSQGGLGVTIETTNSSGSTSETTLTTHKLIVQDDAVYNGHMAINGSLAVTGQITSAPAPTSSNHITNKQYVDDAIAAAITPPQVFDYDVTSSTNTDTVYYINGDLLMYSTMESGQENYEITVFGSDLGDVTGATLRARGNSLDLYGVNETWTAAGDGASATFNISYSAIVAQLGGQTDGYISTHLVLTTATATYQSGMTIRFYLDSTNAVASGSTFTDPE
ncbi:hypothetical protein N9M80_03950, partial [Flavobacteriales bacterium]|nr:hypothetical protein [Flavobacteriales bacterium]